MEAGPKQCEMHVFLKKMRDLINVYDYEELIHNSDSYQTIVDNLIYGLTILTEKWKNAMCPSAAPNIDQIDLICNTIRRQIFFL